MPKTKFYFPFFLFLNCFLVQGQQKTSKAMDSLTEKNYQYLIDKIDAEKDGSETSAIYATAYLAKAKAEKNWKEMFNAYKSILYQVEKRERIIYADSMILAAKHAYDNDLIGSAYLTKGIVYYDFKDHNSALDNYLIANKYITETKDKYLEHKVKYNIAQIKYYLGFYNDAESLFIECVNYYRNTDQLPYLASLHALGQCYNRLGKYDLCTTMNNLGINEATKFGEYDAIPRFIHSEGINQYFKRNYSVSIGKLLETLPSLIKSKDFANETVSNFYLGKNYWALNQKTKAVDYFLKVDKVFTEENYMRPDLRENYELLIDYYKEFKNLQQQLYFIKQLMLADEFLDNNYKYLSGRIFKEYDQQKLLQEKRKIELALKEREQLNILFGGIIIALFAMASYWLFRSISYKRKFKALLERRKQVPKSTNNEVVALDINQEVIASVLKHLEKFESTEKYLAKDLTLVKLAKMFDSNVVYVSKIIAHYKQKKSVDYINDLRVEYIINKLKSESKFRNYTNKALAEEAGFSTTQHFTRAFNKNTGIPPAYFIQRLIKTINKEQ